MNSHGTNEKGEDWGLGEAVGGEDSVTCLFSSTQATAGLSLSGGLGEGDLL